MPPPTVSASQAVASAGTYLEINDGGTWKWCGEITSITGPGRKKDTIEATHLMSPSRYREWLSSWKDGGSLTCVGNHTPKATGVAGEGYVALEAAFESNDSFSFRLNFPTDKTGTVFERYNITALVIDLGPAFETDSEQTFSLELKVTGPVTREAGGA